MADQYPWHVCVHHVESYGMILLGDLVFDIYEQVPVACHVSTIVGLELVVGVVNKPSLAIHPTQVRKQSLEFMQWNAARLRPRINLTSIIMVPALPGILMVTSVMISDLSSGSVSVIQPLRGLTLSIGALSHFTMNCKARKTCCTYLPLPVLKGTVF